HRPLQLAGAFRGRQRAFWPDQGAADLLVVCEPGVRFPDNAVQIGPRLEHEHRVHTFLCACPDRGPHYRRSAHAGEPVEDPLNVFGEHVEAFRGDDHFLLAASDEQLAIGTDLANVAGMEPAVLEGSGGLLGRVEIASRDVLPADEDLAVGRDLHLYPRDGLAHRTPPGAEGMVEGHDWGSFGQAISLDHGKAELSPKRFERGVERRRTDDERPELQSKKAMDPAVPPPAPGHPLLRAGGASFRHDST